MPKGGCRARWTFRSTNSAASRRRTPAVLADLFARDGRDKRDLVYVASPLGRARAPWICARGARPAGGRYAIDDRLREIGYGEWEGSTLAEMQAKDPELYAKRLTQKWTMSSPGGETYAAVQVRMRDWYDQVKSDTVAVAHGGTCRALMVALGHETPTSASDLYIEQGVVYVFADGTLRKYS
jgi:probable phosphoglycerate mutase